ncbi:hypothetical protein CWN94_09355 [Vibrio splendidus]|uniref:hypothetical protein n=1 Tax=Vibrio TaxID=662 RepID=UPI000D3388E7|nr:hypothetical protein [Vibrio splendidus]PTO54738.1 hypothetical protein CWN94_09355 [Vibrio splendidus]
MTVNDIVLEIESTIEDLTEQAESLRDKVETTVNHAHEINERVLNKHERYVPLDDQPYGEELIRTDVMLESIDKQIIELQNLEDEKDVSRVVAIIKNVEEVINEHSETFHDCFSDRFIEEASKEVDDCFTGF